VSVGGAVVSTAGHLGVRNAAGQARCEFLGLVNFLPVARIDMRRVQRGGEGGSVLRGDLELAQLAVGGAVVSTEDQLRRRGPRILEVEDHASGRQYRDASVGKLSLELPLLTIPRT
jgi:hypothetical protein